MQSKRMWAGAGEEKRKRARRGDGEGMRKYLVRCFDSCRNESEVQVMKMLIEERIRLIKTKSSVEEYCWSVEPIPKLPIGQESDAMKRQRRKERFHMHTPTSTVGRVVDTPSEGVVVGCSQAIWKPYLRLTSAPKPEAVRPKKVLRLSFSKLQQIVKEGSKSYKWISEQYKSIRQDLTVQHINEHFTVKVYEANAEVAIAHEDVSELNQCLTQLSRLYDDGIQSSKSATFIGLKVLYYIHCEDLLSLALYIKRLSTALLAQVEIQQAIQVVRWIQIGNSYQLFRYYHQCPDGVLKNMLHFMLHDIRLHITKILLKSYKPTIPVALLSHRLGYHDIAMLHTFFTQFDISIPSILSPAQEIDCKTLSSLLIAYERKKEEESQT